MDGLSVTNYFALVAHPVPQLNQLVDRSITIAANSLSFVDRQS